MLQGPPFNPGDMIPVMGMVTGIVSMVVIGVVIVKVAQAMAARKLRAGAGDQELREEVMELRELVSHLEQRIAEGEERIDFTERLLTHGKDEAPKHG